MTIFFKSISDFFEFHELDSSLTNKLELVDVASISKKSLKKPKFFKASFFTITLFKKAGGLFLKGESMEQIVSKSIYISNPSHLQSYDIKPQTEGSMILFDISYLERVFGKTALSKFSFLTGDNILFTKLNESFFEDMCFLSEQLSKKCNDKSLQTVFFELFLLKLKEIMLYQVDDNIGDCSKLIQSFQINLERALRDLVEEKISINNAYFAKKQEMDELFLTSLIQERTGKSIEDWFLQKRIIDSQAWLDKKRTTIQEIVRILGFSDIACYSKYFQKYTGQTPGEYRKLTNI